MNRCGNCGRYPFCDKIINIDYCCSSWTSLKGLCINCLGCNRLEDENFTGVYRCKNWRSTNAKEF